MKKNWVKIVSTLAVLVIGSFLLLQTDLLKFGKDKPPDSASSKTPPAQQKSAKAEQSSAQKIPVNAMIVNPKTLKDYITVNGSTQPMEEVDISSEVSGKIAKILFTEGSRVEKGELLVKLNDAELKAQKEKLLVEKALAEKIAGRMENLYEKEGVSLQEYEVAAAEVDKYQADIKLLETQLEKTLIKAPFSGVLGLKMVSVGNYVSAGTPIVHLVSLQPIALEFSIPEKYSYLLQKGSRVQFTLSGLERTYSAKVIARQPQIDATTRTLTVKASAPNPQNKILPGAFASVVVNLQHYDQAISIPTEAIVPELGGKKVFLFKNGKASPVQVETGIRQNKFIQVISGIENGDTVITSGVLQIRPGTKVHLTEILSE